MRITNSMLASMTLRDINKAAARLAKANETVSSGQQIQSASEDPVVATRAITYRSYVSKIAQYQDNVDAATGWQKTTDTALDSLSDVIQKVQELATSADDTKSDSDLSTIATEVSSLRDEAISIMNTTYDGRYIFGGYNTSEAPYKLVSTDLGDTVTFKGEYLNLGGVVSSDIDASTIESFYTANADDIYESSTSVNTAVAAATTATTNATATADTLSDAVTTYGGTTTLTAAAASALADYNTAAANAVANPTDTTLAAAATVAKNTSDTLATAVTTYGGTTTLTTAATTAANAATAAKNTSDTLVAAASTYGGTTTLAAAAKSAAKAAAAAADTADTVADAASTYGGTTTLSDAVSAAYSKTAVTEAQSSVTSAYTALGSSATTEDTALDTAYTAYTAYAAAIASGDADTIVSTKAAFDTAAAADGVTASLTTAYDALTMASAAADTLASVAADDSDPSTTTLTTAAATTAAAAATAKATATTLADAVNTYGGTSTDESIQYNIGFDTKVTVNTEGQDVTGEGADNLFDTFAKLLLALNGDTSYKTATVDATGTVTVTTESLSVNSLLTELSTDYDRMLTAQTALGTSMDYVNDMSSNLDDAATAYATLKSDNENADTAAAATEESCADYAYEAALSVGAKVITKTLIDYIA